MTPIENIAWARQGLLVQRYHARPTLQTQLVGQHSAGVALLLAALVGPQPSERLSRLLLAALAHDLPEHVTGDVPGPFKSENPRLKAALETREELELRAAGLHVVLDYADERLLKIADLAEGALFCCEERMLGHVGIAKTFQNYWQALTAVLNSNDGLTDGTAPNEACLRTIIADKWEEAHGTRP